MNPKLFLFLFFVFLAGVNSLFAKESRDGFIRLNINERNGSFSIYFLVNPENMEYVPLLNPHDARTSYLSVKVNNRVYRLGRSRAFRTRVETINNNPAVIFESASLIIRKVFTPVRTLNSPNANGIRISISVENVTEYELSVGLRLLLDTHLGEGRGLHPFITDNKIITRETIIDQSSAETFWISRNIQTSLMGNIINLFDDGSRAPDFLHFANWRKLDSVPWYAPYRPGRRFNHLPYSIGDSAVAYFWEPAVLGGRQSFTYSVFLTTEDIEWYSSPEAPRVEAATINITEEYIEAEEDSHLLTLLALRELLESFIMGEILLNEQDLLEIEWAINRLEYAIR